MGKYRIAFELEGNKALLRNILESIRPELGGSHERRSSTRMNINKNVLSLEIDAEDLTALKASFNSYMKLMILCKNMARL